MTIYRWAFVPAVREGDRRLWGVLLGTIAVALALGGAGLQAGFAEGYSVQDDARQHVFWMGRLVDPGAFPGDVIADYFQTVAPWAYQGGYRLAAAVGLDPLLFNKLLPMPLGVMTAIYGSVLGWMMMPAPAAALLGSVLLQISLWMRDDLVSGTAVAFAVPLMLPVLVHGFRNQRLPFAIALLLLTGTYPQCALVMLGTLTLGALPGWWMMKRSPRATYLTVAIAWCVVMVGVAPYLLRDNPFGPVMGAAEARTLGTFAPKAWSSFFTDDAWNFWVCGQRSGLFPPEWCRLMSNHSVLLLPLWMVLAPLLPLMTALRRQFPLVIYLQPASRLAGQLLLVSLGWFALAHQLLFRLHLPNRYTEHSLRIITALVGGIVITLILERCWRTWLDPESGRSSATTFGLVGGAIAVILLTYPMALNAKDYDFPTTNYTAGIPSLHQFLREQPMNTVVASLEKEADNIPALAGRSIYVGAQGYILPYHTGFYQEMVGRLERLVEAQYSDRWETIRAFLGDTKITHWLINRDSFSEQYLDARQFRQFGLGGEIRTQLRQGLQPVLPSKLDQCQVWNQDALVLVSTACLIEASDSQSAKNGEPPA